MPDARDSSEAFGSQGSIPILGFFAQPPEKVYFRDDAMATGSGMTRIGHA
jgi:hypothetical protein